MSTLFDLSITDKLLSTTRAVRRRLDCDRAVEKQVILDCIALSQQAPTGSNAQSWRWIVVTDEDKRKKIGDIYRSLRPFMDMSRDTKPANDTQTQSVYDAAEYLLDNLARIPMLVFPCIQDIVTAETDHCSRTSIYGSIFPAVWNFQLALRSRGLGSTLTTIHLLKEQEIADLLGIPDDVMQVGMLPVAYTKGTEFKSAKRPPPETITHFNSW